MKLRGSLLFGLLLVFGSLLNSLSACAATPSFTVSAANVTMPSSGDGSIPFTLTSVNGYVGTIVLQCPEVNAPVGARVPSCGGGGPLLAYTLAANATVTGSLTLLPYGDVVPAPVSFRPYPSHKRLPVAVASVLLLGVAFGKRRRARWPTLALVLFGALTTLGGIVGCGDGTPGMTPGTYTYTVTATDLKTNVVVDTTANVTVR